MELLQSYPITPYSITPPLTYFPTTAEGIGGGKIGIGGLLPYACYRNLPDRRILTISQRPKKLADRNKTTPIQNINPPP